MILPVTSRPAATDADYWSIHRLLTDHVRRTPLGFNLDVRSWEGARFYSPTPGGDSDWSSGVQL